ncbi:uncharacterized protein P884DRAFT_241610 [Thermothelomyces heterothallicus CBS 202.75]|uniref:uncharacterized protein n=1 Tax=Thermothelomyces heterothallicus CBS 202.75 TaxID=1149848 RepID=UPI0037435524
MGGVWRIHSMLIHDTLLLCPVHCLRACFVIPSGCSHGVYGYTYYACPLVRLRCCDSRHLRILRISHFMNDKGRT